jgi:hypothetical protein
MPCLIMFSNLAALFYLVTSALLVFSYNGIPSSIRAVRDFHVMTVLVLVC